MNAPRKNLFYIIFTHLHIEYDGPNVSFWIVVTAVTFGSGKKIKNKIMIVGMIFYMVEIHFHQRMFEAVRSPNLERSFLSYLRIFFSIGSFSKIIGNNS